MSEHFSLKVGVRLRGLIKTERELKKTGGNKIAWHSTKQAIKENIKITEAAKTGQHSNNSKRKEHEFIFDRVFGPNDGTDRVYQELYKDIVMATCKGYHGTIFAYGQTASGKTHTMMGTPEAPGIIPQALADLFEHMSSSDDKREYLIQVSYLELYNEEFKDLLNPSAKLRLKDDPKKGTIVEPLEARVVKDVEAVMELIVEGTAARHVGSTNMNEKSSRSHSILQIVVESMEKLNDRSATSSEESEQKIVRQSILNLVDLAGSERISKTGNKVGSTRLKEGININRSLLTLGTVISKLSKRHEHVGSRMIPRQRSHSNNEKRSPTGRIAANRLKEKRGSEMKPHATHIPYRDSKLTRILQSSLGGNARTGIIATVSPVLANYGESLSTLRFASRAKKIKNKVKVNEIMDKDSMITKFKNEILDLKQQLANAKRDTSMEVEKKLHEKVEEETKSLKVKLKFLQKVMLGSNSRLSAESRDDIDESTKEFAEEYVAAQSPRQRHRRNTSWMPGGGGRPRSLDFRPKSRRLSRVSLNSLAALQNLQSNESSPSSSPKSPPKLKAAQSPLRSRTSSFRSSLASVSESTFEESGEESEDAHVSSKAVDELQQKLSALEVEETKSKKKIEELEHALQSKTSDERIALDLSRQSAASQLKAQAKHTERLREELQESKDRLDKKVKEVSDNAESYKRSLDKLNERLEATKHEAKEALERSRRMAAAQLKAQEEVTTRLQTELDITTNKLDGTKEELENEVREKQRLKDELASSNSDCAGLKKVVRRLESTIIEKDESIRSERSRGADIESRLMASNHQIDDFQRELFRASQQLSQSASECAKLKALLDQAKMVVDMRGARIRELEANDSEHSRNADKARAKIQSLEHEHESQKADFMRLRSELEEEQRERGKYASEAGDLRSCLNALRKEYDIATEAKEKAYKDLEQTNETMKTLRAEKSKLQSLNSTLETKLRGAEISGESLEAELNNEKKSRAATEEQLRNLRSRAVGDQSKAHDERSARRYAEERIEILEQRLKDKNAEVTSCLEKFETLSKERVELIKTVSDCNAALRDRQVERANYELEIKGLEQKLSDSEARFDATASDMARELEAQRAKSASARSTLESELSEVSGRLDRVMNEELIAARHIAQDAEKHLTEMQTRVLAAERGMELMAEQLGIKTEEVARLNAFNLHLMDEVDGRLRSFYHRHPLSTPWAKFISLGGLRAASSDSKAQTAGSSQQSLMDVNTKSGLALMTSRLRAAEEHINLYRECCRTERRQRERLGEAVRRLRKEAKASPSRQYTARVGDMLRYVVDVSTELELLRSTSDALLGRSKGRSKQLKGVAKQVGDLMHGEYFHPPHPPPTDRDSGSRSPPGDPVHRTGDAAVTTTIESSHEISKGIVFELATAIEEIVYLNERVQAVEERVDAKLRRAERALGTKGETGRAIVEFHESDAAAPSTGLHASKSFMEKKLASFDESGWLHSSSYRA